MNEYQVARFLWPTVYIQAFPVGENMGIFGGPQVAHQTSRKAPLVKGSHLDLLPQREITGSIWQCNL